MSKTQQMYDYVVCLSKTIVYLLYHVYARSSSWVFRDWVLITGGCSGRGVQPMGLVLYNKLVYNIR